MTVVGSSYGRCYLDTLGRKFERVPAALLAEAEAYAKAALEEESEDDDEDED